MSPQLAVAENEKLFGAAASPFGHGHNYRARVTLEGELAAQEQVSSCLASLRDELDHKNLNNEVPGLTDQPITTEILARFIYRRAAEGSPVSRVRLHDRSDFFAENWKGVRIFLGLLDAFNATHRLKSERMTAEENAKNSGKINNAGGHGHVD